MTSPTRLLALLAIPAALAFAPATAGATQPPPPPAPSGTPVEATVEIGADGAAAEAAIEQASGFVVHTPSGNQGWSSNGPKPTVTALGTGSWRVRFPGISGTFGVPIVTPAPGVAGSQCAIDEVGLSNGAVAVTLHCFKANGTPANAGFALSYTSFAGGNEAWFTTDQPSNGSGYTPKPSYSSVGLSIISRSAAGRHYTLLKNLQNLQQRFALTSAKGTGAVQCGFVAEGGIEDNSLVEHTWCTDSALTAVETPSTTHVFTTDMFGGPAGDAGKDAHAIVALNGPTSYYVGAGAYADSGTVTVARVGKGVTKVTIAGGATPGAGLAHVMANNALGYRCNASAADQGANEVITVKCFDPTGAPIDYAYRLAYFGAA